MSSPRFAFVLALTLAGPGLFAAASAASAYPAAATAALNVRNGPGTQYDVVGVLERGQTVEVLECTDGWCQVRETVLSGWASARYLAPVDADAIVPGSAPPPDSDVDFTIETPDFSFAVGNGNRPGYRPSSVGQVCFHDAHDYRGRQFCAGSGDEDRYLAPAWNDQIRSIAIEGGAEITVCTEVDLSGQCILLSQSEANLGDMSDAISSYRINLF